MLLRANTILYCANWQETVAFYRDTLRFRVTFENEWFVEFQLAGAAHLSIADEARATIKSAENASITLAWQVGDVELWRDQLITNGVECTPLARRFGSTVTYFYDPAGHRIELWQK